MNNFINSPQQQNNRKADAMTAEQEKQEGIQNEEEIHQGNQGIGQEVEQRDYVDSEEPTEQNMEQTRNRV